MNRDYSLTKSIFIYLQKLIFDKPSFDKVKTYLENEKDLKINALKENIMKKLIGLFVLVLTITLLSFNSPAWAGDATNGAKIFSANCAACHMGGRNVVNPAKTLQKGDLEKYGKDSLEGIISQVTKGYAAMPAFSGKLSASEIEDVATYVLDKSNAGW